MFNIELAVDVLAHIQLSVDAGTNQWSQAAWCLTDLTTDKTELVQMPTTIGECGTSYCYAGWALALSGVPFEVPMHYNKPYDVSYKGKIYGVAKAASILLDYEYEDSYEDGPMLYNSYNDLDDLYEMTAEAAGIDLASLETLVQERMLNIKPKE